MKWKDETCEYCRFRVDAACRRFPPLASGGYFPQVLSYTLKGKEEFNMACGEYRPVFKASENQ